MGCSEFLVSGSWVPRGSLVIWNRTVTRLAALRRYYEPCHLQRFCMTTDPLETRNQELGTWNDVVLPAKDQPFFLIAGDRIGRQHYLAAVGDEMDPGHGIVISLDINLEISMFIYINSGINTQPRA